MLHKENIKRIFKCSPMQKGMFFLYKLNPSSKQHIVQYCFDLKGEIQPANFKEAFRDVCKRYDVLRTIFVQKTTDYPIQIVLKEIELDFTFTDVTTATNTKTKQEFLEADLEKGFQIDKTPCVRLQLIKQADRSYACIFTFHHIIMDGWCNSIIINDFMTFYAARTLQLEMPKTPVPNYESYIQWLDKQNAVEATNFWKNYLSDYQNQLKIPFLKTQNELLYLFENQTITFEAELSTKIEILAKENDVTLNAVCQLLWAIVLAKINDVSDVVFGVVSSGRPTEVADSDKILGLFINTIPIRISWDKSTTIREVLKQSFEKINAVQEYSYLQLADIQQQSEQSRNLIDHIFIFENYPKNIEDLSNADELKTLDLRLENTQVFDQTNYHFNIIAKKNEHIEFKFLYNASLISANDIEIIGEYLQHVANQIVENPADLLSTISLAPKQHLAMLTGASHEIHHESLVSYWKQSVSTFGSRIAVTHENQEFTYHEIDQLSNAFAGFLQKNHAVTNGDRVVVALERSERMLIAVWSILKLGASIVPIDINYPERRKEYILQDANATCIVDESMMEAWQNSHETFAENEVTFQSPNRESICYIIYTSGTTGKPNGTMLTHENMINLVHFHDATTIKRSKVLQFAPLVFDVSFQEIFATHLNGGTLYLIHESVRYNVEKLFQFVEKHAIETLFLPTSYLKYISNTNEVLQAFPSCVQDIIVAGERLIINNNLKEFLWNRNVRLHNHYGPSETHVITAMTVNTDAEIDKIPSIGTPIQNTTICIMSETDQIQAKGGVGQLLVSGKPVGKGYVHNETLTQKKFVTIAGKNYYKTGDKAYIHSDNTIHYLGRIDDQIKYRGYRIELSEIAATILQNKAVKEAVVILHEEAPSVQKLVAFIIAETTFDTTTLQTHLNGHLPHYMIPTSIIRMDAFPMTHNGKVDKRKLQNDFVSNTVVELGTESLTLEEEKIIAIWKEILNINAISRNDNFLNLGGHSLQFIQLAGRYSKHFKVTVSFRELFLNATVKAHAALIISKSKGDLPPKIPKTAVQEHYPLSAAQMRMWTLSQFENADRAHNIVQAFEFSGNLETEKLVEAISKVVMRHEILRTYFIIDAQHNIRQLFVPSAIFQTDLTYIHPATLSDVDAVIEKKYKTVFDLEKGPLWNVTIVKTGEEQHILILTIHHIICDGWSMKILAKEVLTHYHHLQKNQEKTLPALSIQYKDYVAWLQMPKQQQQIQKEEAYWLKKFKGEIPQIKFPTSKKRPALKTYNGDSVSVTFSKTLSESIKKYNTTSESTLFMTLLAGVNALLYRYTNETDIIVGTPTAGRIHEQLEDQLGLYLNTLAIRTHFEKESNFAELTSLVKEELSQTYSNQLYPFDKLVDQLQLERDLSRSPLFDILVVLQNFQNTIVEETQEPTNLSVTTYSGNTRKLSMFDLKFVFQEYAHGIHVLLEFNADIYAKAQIKKALSHLENLLQHVIQQPKVPINELHYLSPSEEETILQSSGQLLETETSKETIVSTFKNTVQQFGSEIALVGEEKQVTYNDLDVLSDQLASYLKTTYAIQPKSTIAIQLERSEWVFVAMLSVLKLGNAFVPIAIDAPSDRTAFMLKDSACVLNIDQSVIQQFELQEANNEVITFPEVSSSMTAYIIYTSGTTGKPKGVSIPHKALVNYANWFKNTHHISAGDRSVVLSLHTFDLIYTSVFGCLLSGASLHVPSENLISDLKGISNYIIKHHISFLKITPMYLNALLNVKENILTSSSLKLIVCGGEKPIINDVRSVVEAGKIFVNHYGPTETTIGVCAHEVTRDNLKEFEENTVIGTPVTNTQLFILDEKQQLCADNIVGELCISGAQLSDGYVNLQPLTEEKFIQHPTLSKRIFRTGDLAKRLPNGTILCLGRKDNQLKIRGYRVELEEVEHVLAAQTHMVQKAAVLVKEHNSQQRLVAFIVAQQENFDEIELRVALQNSLPNYMLPASFVQITEMPLNANGKVDKKELLLKGVTINSVSKTIVEASNHTEEVLVSLLKKALDTEKISVKDNFFDLGVNSIMLIKLLYEINAMLKTDVKLMTIFQHPTVERLAQVLHSSNEDTTSKLLNDIEENVADDEVYDMFDE
ncbi:gramicidin S synthase 2 [Kordia sp. SMS9]|uniref:non-ribosomal peptide synthetase n=1 Tax=Kordia sp. SMS9 TaxID=2282170 RepID=UPI000E0CC122|nr:non-ribosomal peptide synthetase [Kordia sp. SMS9]AXG70727.1 gramicidin S synthase 2 [Kordia sp. SMS9]